MGWVTFGPFAPFLLSTAAGLVAFGATSCAVAQSMEHPQPAATETPSLPSTLNDKTPCVQDAARFHGVNPWVLKAILSVESGFNPRAINRNSNSTVDVGLGQMNSMHFKELSAYGIAPGHLLDGCVATYVAAWHLAKQVRRHGNTWFGIASYHSATPCLNARYAGLLWNTLTAWRVVPGPKVRVSRIEDCGGSPSVSSRPHRGGGVSASIAFDSD